LSINGDELRGYNLQKPRDSLTMHRSSSVINSGRRFEFVDESYEGDIPAISCDGLGPGAALDLTQWQGNHTPRRYKARSVLSRRFAGESRRANRPWRFSVRNKRMVRITLSGAALFSMKMALVVYADDMLNLGFDCPLQRDKAADSAAFRLLVQVVELPALFKPECEAVQRVEA
jgi:hypothetical protein